MGSKSFDRCRLRLPVYVIQPIDEQVEPQTSPAVRSVAKPSDRFSYLILLALALCLSTAIGLLAALLAHDAICPVDHCASMALSSSTSRFPSTTTNGNASFSSTTSGLRHDLLYGETCRDHQECHASKQLFCQYEFDANEKHCFCETTHFWNRVEQQCGEMLRCKSIDDVSFRCLERKKELNEGSSNFEANGTKSSV